MLFQLKIKRDTAADFQSANTVLADGEFGLETDTGKMKIGNGSTAYNSLQFVTEDDALSWRFGGSTKGFVSGGTGVVRIDSMTFASDGNATTDWGDIPALSNEGMQHGFSSTTNGYHAHGYSLSKFPFAAAGNGVAVPTGVRAYTATGNSSSEAGYTVGGYPSATSADKMPFATDTKATVPALAHPTNAAKNNTGVPSPTYGYHFGGSTPGADRVNNISRWPFAADDAISDQGDLVSGGEFFSGTASETHGYVLGGQTGPSPTAPTANAVLYKWAFASTGNAADIGNLTIGRVQGTGISSHDNGYSGGGTAGGNPSFLATFEKHSFASDSNSTTVGSGLEGGTGKKGASGQQDSAFS
jgi:hypothetical protein